MNFSFKFIHAADIHLGSMLNVYDEKIEDTDPFKNAVYDAFERIVDYALKFKVKFLLISGDLYDRDSKSIRANSFFNFQCKRLLEEDINVYIIAGNHDPFVGKREVFKLPDNVFICDSEKCSEFYIKDRDSKVIARVYGNSYRSKSDSRKLYNSYNPPEDFIFNIAMLHTELNSNNANYAPCTLENLKSKSGIDYWALGHIHKCKIINKSNPIIAYSGVPQGRDIGEEGMGGCLLVEVDEKSNASINFLPVSSIVWKKVEIDINEDIEKEPENLSELISFIEERAQRSIDKIDYIPCQIQKDINLNNIIKGYAVRWIIKGRGSIKSVFEEVEDNVEDIIKESLNSRFMNYYPFIYTDSIDVRLERVLDIEKLRSSNNVIREIYELSDAALKEDNLKKDIMNVFGQVWEKNYDDENINYLKIQLNRDNFEEIIRKARELVIYKLMEDS